MNTKLASGIAHTKEDLSRLFERMDKLPINFNSEFRRQLNLVQTNTAQKTLNAIECYVDFCQSYEVALDDDSVPLKWLRWCNSKLQRGYQSLAQHSGAVRKLFDLIYEKPFPQKGVTQFLSTVPKSYKASIRFKPSDLARYLIDAPNVGNHILYKIAIFACCLTKTKIGKFTDMAYLKRKHFQVTNDRVLMTVGNDLRRPTRITPHSMSGVYCIPSVTFGDTNTVELIRSYMSTVAMQDEDDRFWQTNRGVIDGRTKYIKQVVGVNYIRNFPQEVAMWLLLKDSQEYKSFQFDVGTVPLTDEERIAHNAFGLCPSGAVAPGRQLGRGRWSTDARPLTQISGLPLGAPKPPPSVPAPPREPDVSRSIPVVVPPGITGLLKSEGNDSGHSTPISGSENERESRNGVGEVAQTFLELNDQNQELRKQVQYLSSMLAKTPNHENQMEPLKTEIAALKNKVAKLESRREIDQETIMNLLKTNTNLSAVVRRFGEGIQPSHSLTFNQATHVASVASPPPTPLLGGFSHPTQSTPTASMPTPPQSSTPSFSLSLSSSHSQQLALPSHSQPSQFSQPSQLSQLSGHLQLLHHSQPSHSSHHSSSHSSHPSHSSHTPHSSHPSHWSHSSHSSQSSQPSQSSSRHSLELPVLIKEEDDLMAENDRSESEDENYVLEDDAEHSEIAERELSDTYTFDDDGVPTADGFDESHQFSENHDSGSESSSRDNSRKRSRHTDPVASNTEWNDTFGETCQKKKRVLNTKEFFVPPPPPPHMGESYDSSSRPATVDMDSDEIRSPSSGSNSSKFSSKDVDGHLNDRETSSLHSNQQVEQGRVARSGIPKLSSKRHKQSNHQLHLGFGTDNGHQSSRPSSSSSPSNSSPQSASSPPAHASSSPLMPSISGKNQSRTPAVISACQRNSARDWSVDHVLQWLKTVPVCVEYAGMFRKKCVNGLVLPALSEQMLERVFGMKFSHIVEFRKAVRKLSEL